ncbi:MAG: phytoene desaturase family protein [Anaerolineales bacterium]
MANTYDSIVIGAGHNGLTTAAYLAKAGQRVLVLERRAVVGGSVVTEEVWPGYHVDAVQHRGALRADIVRDLSLMQHGLQPTQPGVIFAPQLDGSALTLSPDLATSIQSIARFSKNDAGKWPAFGALMSQIAGFLNDTYATTFPRVPKIDPAEAPVLAQLGLKLRGLGKKEMMEALRVLPMSLTELLDEWFESDALKGAIGARGVHGVMQGSMGAGTAFLLLHHWANSNGLFQSTVKGGVGQISQALAKAAQSFGAEIRTNAEVAEICVSEGRTTGVRLAGGEEFHARRIISAADPRRTFLTLVGPMALDPEFVWAAQNIKMRGCVAKVNLALDGLPDFRGAVGADGRPPLQGTIVISPSLTYLERAYDAAKYGSLSAQPYLEVTLPSVADPSLAPVGKHVMSVHAQYMPYKGKIGESEIERVVIETLSQYAPNLKSLISNSQILTPQKLESDYSLTEGNLYHGEMMLDQILFMRPIAGWAQHKTPIENLYLCGPGTHPGGGVSGGSGRNAARQILKDMKA